MAPPQTLPASRTSPWARLARLLRVLWFHTRRAFDLPTGSTALLADGRHPVRRGWLVRLVRAAPGLPGDEPGGPLELRMRHDGDEVVVRLAHRGDAPPPGSGPRGWILLASGHARRLTGLAVDGREVRLTLGDEHLASTSGQAVLEPGLGSTEARDTLLALYAELGAQHRALVEVRFKLLALVPAISALALVGVVGPTGPFAGTPRIVRVGAAVLGLIVVVGVRLYDVRNSQLHDDLVSRGRSTETALGVRYGVFARRRPSTFPVQHDVALHLVYGAVLAAWVGAVVAAVLA